MDNKKKNNNDDITINLRESALADFTRSPMPTDKEVAAFNNYSGKEAKEANEVFDSEINGVSDEEIEESLEEIYQDDKGNRVDVKRMQILKKHGLVFWILSFIFFFGAVAVLSYTGYSYYLKNGTDETAVDFSVSTETDVVAGQEFDYTIHYKNNGKVDILIPRVETTFPDNFVLLSSEPKSEADTKGLWDLPTLSPQAENDIKIHGMIIGKKDLTQVFFSKISYTPQNFSSEFTKEDSASILVKDTGFDISIDYVKAVLVGMENSLTLNVVPKEKSFLNGYQIRLEVPETFKYLVKKTPVASSTAASKNAPKTTPSQAVFQKMKDGLWQVATGTSNISLPVAFSFTGKGNGNNTVKAHLEKEVSDGRTLEFYEEDIPFEVMKNDLNLALIINGTRENKGVNFGDTLNYTIAYNNKGESAMQDLVIMAVISSDFLDWSSLNMKVKGQVKDNTIIWTKNEIPALASVEKHQEGTIDFSINVASSTSVEGGKKYQVDSYAQFIVGQVAEGQTVSKDNHSNEIINTINSDLKLEELVRYFNEDNITVGNGPLPLKVGERTSFKVNWSVLNNLHELSNLKIEVSLPAYVEWDEKNRTNVGTVSYDAVNRKVVWDVGRLPLTVFRADAEFNIAVTPTADDVGKIMVLLPGAKVSATDTETGENIEKIIGAKTSQLEDDPIAQQTNDGVVR